MAGCGGCCATHCSGTKSAAKASWQQTCAADDSGFGEAKCSGSGGLSSPHTPCGGLRIAIDGAVRKVRSYYYQKPLNAHRMRRRVWHGAGGRRGKPQGGI